jgi:hypothetical protein
MAPAAMTLPLMESSFMRSPVFDNNSTGNVLICRKS